VPAVGFDGPDFLNAAAIIADDLDPFALTRMAAALERDNGRVRGAVKFSDRTLDVDLVYFDDLVLDLPQLHCRGRNCAMPSCCVRLPTSRRTSSIPCAAKRWRELWRAHPEHDAPMHTRAALDLSIRPPSSRSTWPVV
jgi:2-amino-4-hydroxy-6-hydroxymethyldihydropteridine diphosphokinase